MKLGIATILTVLVAAFPMNSFGDTGAVEREVKKLEQAYESLQDMQAGFRQETASAAVPVVQHAAGQVFFKKKGKMLWKYETPEEQLIVLDGTTLWFYLPAEKQAMKNNFTTVPRHIVGDLFRGRIDILAKFKVRFPPGASDTANGHVVLELAPIEPDPTLATLVLWIDPANSMVSRTVMTDSFGNRTELTFQDIVVDKGLPDKLFTFTPPDGVDIFEPPQL